MRKTPLLTVDKLLFAIMNNTTYVTQVRAKLDLKTGKIYHFPFLETHVQSQEYYNCFQFLWCVSAFNLPTVKWLSVLILYFGVRCFVVVVLPFDMLCPSTVTRDCSLVVVGSCISYLSFVRISLLISTSFPLESYWQSNQLLIFILI